MKINRCQWCNLDNPTYVKYHDEEWCVPTHDEKLLFEFLILESFQAGLSWEIILNKRQAFKLAFSEYDIDKICSFDEEKITQLMQNPDIVRNRRKIESAINNAKIFRKIQCEYVTFDKYLWGFTNGKTIYETGRTTSPLSDALSRDLQRRGMKFVGSTIVYSYLQAVGVLYSHEKDCFMYREKAPEEK